MLKAKKATSSTHTPRIIGMGSSDFQYELTLTDDDMSRYNIPWDSIETISDISFLTNHKDLWNRITLTSNNFSINLLLFLNKSHNKKSFIEYIVFDSPDFTEEEAFLNEIIHYVTEHNYLFLNCEAKICKSNNHSNVTFTVKNGYNAKKFSLGQKNKTISDDTTDIICNENSPNAFEKIKCEYKMFDYFYVDIGEIFDLDRDKKLSIRDFKKYLENLKIISTLNIIINYPNIFDRISEITAEFMKSLTDIMFLTDVYFFEKKDAYNIFNILYQFNSKEDTIKNLKEKKCVDYFIKGIAYCSITSPKSLKVGIFLDDFQKITIAEVPINGEVHKAEYDTHLYPKINHTNQKMVEEYKLMIASEYSFYKSIFFGSMLGKFVNTLAKEKGLQGFYPAYLAGLESTKKMFELKKNQIHLPRDPNFYVVELPDSKVEQDIKTQFLKKKEEKFVLDCLNQKTSRLKYYNPLFDGHLNSFFASDVIRKDLKNMGFLNSKGFIIDDFVYRNSTGNSSPRKRSTSYMENDKQNFDGITRFRVEDNNPKLRKSNSPNNKRFRFLPAIHKQSSNII